MRELCGYTSEKVKDMHFARFVDPEDLQVVTECFMRTMAGEMLQKDIKFDALAVTAAWRLK